MSALKKILVIDDDPSVIKSFDRVLTRKGCVVTGAENGPEALAKAASEDYDAVFTDIRMPGMDGIEVAERLRAKRPWTPVVIITGYGTADHEARAEAAGVSGFLRKPLSPDMIEDGLAAAVATAPEPVAEMVVPVAVVAPPEAAAVAAERAGSRTALKTIAMAVAAPFVGLAFVVTFPLIGLALLAWAALGAENAGRNVVRFLKGTGRFLRNVAMFFAAPFVALAYVALFPVIGLAMLAWAGGRAWHNRGATG
jgi:CheY-like chemotaxis protein